jgi:hypothetical protein
MIAPRHSTLRQLVHARNRAVEKILQALPGEAPLAKSCLFKRFVKAE